MIREGGCLCGAVRFRCEGEPINVRICHCRNCQKAMGSPFFARALFPQQALSVEGETARYASSATIDRVFCKICGTRLFSWRTNGTGAGVALAAFDDRNAFVPTEHIWVAEKMDWVTSTTGCRSIRKRFRNDRVCNQTDPVGCGLVVRDGASAPPLHVGLTEPKQDIH